MKRKISQNSNGISISDSIVMSVKQKHKNLRKPFSAAIAIIGFVSVIMSFLGMYSIHFNTKQVVAAALIILGFHITIAVIGGRALWAYAASILIFSFAVFKKISRLVLGYKYIYNVVYKVSFESKIDYYKRLDKLLEIPSVTTFVIFYMWLLAIVICFFTICRPNPVLPILVSFPLIEIGLYNGVNVPVFWGILCIAYWLAVLSMSTIDVGEYSGGQSGFVRKNNLFFPKRHMKLKVTEKCGMLVICSVMLTAIITECFIKITCYERSDKLNQKRRDISDAVDDFSFSNLAESLARLSNAFGINFEYETHKLGINSRIRYKNVTDLTVKLNTPVSGSLYLKDYVGCSYHDNEWFKYEADVYNDSLFDDFKKFDIYPQDFALTSYNMTPQDCKYGYMQITPSERKADHSYVPYYTVNEGNIEYLFDTLKFPKDMSSREATYKFCTDEIVKQIQNMSSKNSVPLRLIIPPDVFKNDHQRQMFTDYCNAQGILEDNFDFAPDGGNYFTTIDCNGFFDHVKIINDPKMIFTLLLQQRYKEFVYKNYLDVPDTAEMNEVREKFAYLTENKDISTADAQLEVLDNIREKIISTSKYTLSPGKTPSTHDFVNYFLLADHKGYCTHYATSGIMLARMAGIPARYATGYIITGNDISSGEKNPDGSVTINVKDNRSHAWAEVYLEGIGWVPYEFTWGYDSTDIATQPTSEHVTQTTSPDQPTTTKTTSAHTSSISTNTKLKTTAATSTVKVTTVFDGVHYTTPVGTSIGKYIVRFFKALLKLVLYTAAVLFIIWLRRYILLKIRTKKLTTGRPEKRIINTYIYAEKLLSELSFRSKQSNYMQFASDVEKWYGDIYFDKGAFEKLTDIALKAKFSNIEITNEEAKECLKAVEQFADKLYKKSGHLRRLKIKYFKVLR